MTPSRTVLITGCSSGIGAASARLLKSRGHRVIASARKADDVQQLQNEGFEAVRLDLDDSRSIVNAVDTVRGMTNGALDVLFNNAAYGQPGAVEDLSRAALREQFETNLFGTVELTNLVLPMMRARDTGRIIQNSSVLGLVAMPFRGAYNATKFALEGLTDTLRMELRGTGIHVVLIEPGPIATRFRANAYAAYLRHIDAERSPYKGRYQLMEARLKKEGDASAFTLPAEAVAKKVVTAIERNRPKARYYVTTPTYIFGYARRLVSSRVMDMIVSRIS